MLTLGIETSCDETALALVQNNSTVIESLVSSQISTHAQYGGVIPEIAARMHLESLHPLYEKLVKENGLSVKDIDIIAVTQGPGLIGALLVGTSFAKGLALALGKPLVPVNHIHAHVHGALLGLPDKPKETEDVFPALSLVVSGGHTNLFYMKSPVEFHLVAQSLDDACGECFDKVAKLLKLSYPGGPAIEQLARQGDPKAIRMPKILGDKNRLEFSYSGLKTHMLYLLEKEAQLTTQKKADICASFQDAAFEQIIRKLQLAYKKHELEVKSILIAGGVSANKRFRTLLHESFDPLPLFFPDVKYCSDNAAMIASYGTYLYQKFSSSYDNSNHTWEAYSRYDVNKR
jgi:N6-L-threonylcarbamoyladenine synthase